MKRLIVVLLLAVIMLQAMLVHASPAVDSLMQGYRQQGVTSADAEAGKRFWHREFRTEGEMRRCTTCHGDDLRKTGKHATTGKAIEPMAPSVNPERLTEVDKINKWFTRNCKWTVGRECTAQEKADVLEYLSNL